MRFGGRRDGPTDGVGGVLRETKVRTRRCRSPWGPLRNFTFSLVW